MNEELKPKLSALTWERLDKLGYHNVRHMETQDDLVNWFLDKLEIRAAESTPSQAFLDSLTIQTGKAVGTSSESWECICNRLAKHICEGSDYQQNVEICDTRIKYLLHELELSHLEFLENSLQRFRRILVETRRDEHGFF